MELVTMEGKGREEWDAFVHQQPHSIAWQSWDWSALVAAHHGCSFIPLAAREGGALRGILPLYRVPGPRGGHQLMSVPYAVAGGILAADERASTLLLDAAVGLCRTEGARGILLKQYKVKVPGDLRDDSSYYNRELRLSDDPAVLSERITPGNRERVDRALAEKGEFEFPSRDISAFYRLLFRHHHQRGIPCVSERWVRDLVGLGMYSVALVRREGRPAAGTMVKAFKRTVSFPFTCLAGDSEQLAAFRLYWELLRRFGADGFEIAHSGRIPVSDQAEPYRLGWGGDKHPYHYQYYPASTARTEYSSRRNRKRDLFQKVWRATPAPLARALGPRIVRFFP